MKKNERKKVSNTKCTYRNAKSFLLTKWDFPFASASQWHTTISSDIVCFQRYEKNNFVFENAVTKIHNKTESLYKSIISLCSSDFRGTNDIVGRWTQIEHMPVEEHWERNSKRSEASFFLCLANENAFSHPHENRVIWGEREKNKTKNEKENNAKIEQ